MADDSSALKESLSMNSSGCPSYYRCAITSDYLPVQRLQRVIPMIASWLSSSEITTLRLTSRGMYQSTLSYEVSERVQFTFPNPNDGIHPPDNMLQFYGFQHIKRVNVSSNHFSQVEGTLKLDIFKSIDELVISYLHPECVDLPYYTNRIDLSNMQIKQVEIHKESTYLVGRTEECDLKIFKLPRKIEKLSMKDVSVLGPIDLRPFPELKVVEIESGSSSSNIVFPDHPSLISISYKQDRRDILSPPRDEISTQFFGQLRQLCLCGLRSNLTLDLTKAINLQTVNLKFCQFDDVLWPTANLKDISILSRFGNVFCNAASSAWTTLPNIITHSLENLTFEFVGQEKAILDLSMAVNLKSLSLSCCSFETVNYSPHLKSLTLYSNRSPLCQLDFVQKSVSKCSGSLTALKLHEIKASSGVLDLSLLEDMDTLHISHCVFKDLRTPRSCRHIYIEGARTGNLRPWGPESDLDDILPFLCHNATETITLENVRKRGYVLDLSSKPNRLLDLKLYRCMLADWVEPKGGIESTFEDLVSHSMSTDSVYEGDMSSSMEDDMEDD
eukprot:GHVH01004438.1.p1 GENE.GHVH01004438.1~~GHVH01004438.1.p1  ORF type:complete len:557 (+),score=63.37 GHVH01004438.1:144-1814(+)